MMSTDVSSGKGLRRLRGLGGLLVAVLTGCASPPEQAEFEPPKYPPPPAETRFIYEMTLYSSAQVRNASEESKLRQFLTGEKPSSGQGFAKPFDVAACNNTVYVSDTVARRILAFDFAEREFSEIGLDSPGVLRKPLGVAVDAACRLYVADQTLGRVVVYGPEGDFLKAIGEPEQFTRLSHVAVDPKGETVFAVDTGGVKEEKAHWVRVFDVSSGEHLRDIGERGHAKGQFNLPRDAELGPDGRLYVVDGGNFRVQVFEPDGRFVRAFGDIGSQPGQFSRPKGIALDRKGRVYVSDAAFGNFQVFDPEGELLTFVGARGRGGAPGKFMLPAGLDVDENGRIYFVGQFSRKVDVFRPVELTDRLVDAARE